MADLNDVKHEGLGGLSIRQAEKAAPDLLARYRARVENDEPVCMMGRHYTLFDLPRSEMLRAGRMLDALWT